MGKKASDTIPKNDPKKAGIMFNPIAD